MLAYKAMYKYVDGGVHAEVLDFPGAISFGKTLDEARVMRASALVDMAETNLLMGEPLPRPDPLRDGGRIRCGRGHSPEVDRLARDPV